MSDGNEDQVSIEHQQRASLVLKGPVQSEDEKDELQRLRAAAQRRRVVARGARQKATQKRKAEDLVRTSFDVPRALVEAFRGEALQVLARLRKRPPG